MQRLKPFNTLSKGIGRYKVTLGIPSLLKKSFPALCVGDALFVHAEQVPDGSLSPLFSVNTYY
jgi:hypothetical protein